jgi:hypothetical protein
MKLNMSGLYLKKDKDEPMAMLIDSCTPIETELYDSRALRHIVFDMGWGIPAGFVGRVSSG